MAESNLAGQGIQTQFFVGIACHDRGLVGDTNAVFRCLSSLTLDRRVSLYIKIYILVPIYTIEKFGLACTCSATYSSHRVGARGTGIVHNLANCDLASSGTLQQQQFQVS